MKTLSLVLVTSNQNQKDKAEKIGKLVRDVIPNISLPEITKYEKFPNSYKLAFNVKVDEIHFIRDMIILTDKICSPWKVYYNSFDDQMKMIFNRDEDSRFGKVEFNVVRWGNLTIID